MQSTIKELVANFLKKFQKYMKIPKNLSWEGFRVRLTKAGEF